MSEAAVFRQKAEMFEERAQGAADPISRQHYREMAAHYRRAAGRAPRRTILRTGRLAAAVSALARQPIRPTLLHRTLERRPRVHARQPRREVRVRSELAERLSPPQPQNSSGCRRRSATARRRTRGCRARPRYSRGDWRSRSRCADAAARPPPSAATHRGSASAAASPSPRSNAATRYTLRSPRCRAPASSRPLP